MHNIAQGGNMAKIKGVPVEEYCIYLYKILPAPKFYNLCIYRK